MMPTRIIKVTSPERPRILEVMKRSTLVLRMIPNISIWENVVRRQKRKGSLGFWWSSRMCLPSVMTILKVSKKENSTTRFP